MATFQGAKDFLAQQHLAPLLSQVQQNLVSLNKWDTVGKALQVSVQALVELVAVCNNAHSQSDIHDHVMPLGTRQQQRSPFKTAAVLLCCGCRVGPGPGHYQRAECSRPG